MENISETKKILYSAIAVFVIVAVYFLTPPAEFKRTLFPLIALLGVIFLVLGAILIVKARKEKGKLKILLMLTGISATLPAIGSILHNVFYGLGIHFQTLKPLFNNVLGPISFILALMVGPLVFIGGAISLIAFLRKNPAKNETSINSHDK